MTFLVNKAVKAIIETQHKKRELMMKDSEEQANIKNGVIALLRYRINRLCNTIKKRGSMTSQEAFDLKDIYSAYETLGGNGQTKILVEYIFEKHEINDDIEE
eukprot:TRINITY_DN18541_c0_g1_i1.p1 TRINITY_DN18541_c0_g1~~TRINITY_DN18541_c0_g1_i1.p1  ORF type:complete len:102 (-),score=0.53 TRINITY_DN18541_c0_g1_i1:34-339(-)